MLADEVRQVLMELAEAIGAVRVSVEGAPPEAETKGPSQPTTSRALGNDRHLIATLQPNAEDGAVMAANSDVGEAMERAARSLRSMARRWGDDPVPLAVWPETGQEPTHARVLSRIEAYLGGLASSERCRNVLVTQHGQLVAAAREPAELDHERVPFTEKLVAADASSREGTSFGEIVVDDCYARSFWVNTTLIMFFDGPWALDFVRHRARLVCRELGNLLPMLDPPPAAPAQVAPRPE